MSILRSATIPILSWDIFCQVIDNFGDIGICWRLAQQLANEHQQKIRLWVDNLSSFKKICPQVNVEKNTQIIGQVTICKWQHQKITPPKLNQIIVEAFACQLPQEVIKQLSPQNLWLNLEYLTCEKWVQSWHGLPSFQNNNLRKYVYFPSLQPNTGGVLCEQDLHQRLRQFNRQKFLETMKIQNNQGEQLISLFCYEHANLDNWLKILSRQKNPTTILVPQGQIVPQINSFLSTTLTFNNPIKYDNLTVQLLPFMTQHQFDYLLASCDFNIVRGEDSFLRAQFAGKPFLWHIYPQNADAHFTKLTDFLELYLQNYPYSAQITQFFLDFNNNHNWVDLWATIKWCSWHKHAQNWAQTQMSKPSLASLLLRFVAERL